MPFFVLMPMRLPAVRWVVIAPAAIAALTATIFAVEGGNPPEKNLEQEETEGTEC